MAHEEVGWSYVNDVVYQNNPKDRNEAYSRMAPVYDVQMKNVGSVGNRGLVKVAFHLVKNDETSQMLDVAAGTGWTAEHFRESGYVGQIDGIEMNAAMLDIARKRGLYRKTFCMEVVDDTPLPVPENTYDVAIAAGAFLENHLPQGCIPYMVRALKPGGLLIFNCRITEQNSRYQMILRDLLALLVSENTIELVTEEEIDFYQTRCKEDGKPMKAFAFVYRKL